MGLYMGMSTGIYWYVWVIYGCILVYMGISVYMGIYVYMGVVIFV